MENYIVYVKLDSENRIISVNSSAFLTDATDWIRVDEGLGDRFHHAQGNYLEKGLMDENGCYNYKYVDGVVERTVDEKTAEINARPFVPTTDEMLMLAIAELDMQRETDKTETELAIAELAETVLGGV